MEIRTLLPADELPARDLWKISFDDSQRFIDWFFENRYNPEKALGIFDGSGLSAIVHMADYEIVTRGKLYKAPMIIGAATHPSKRKRGLMATLLEESFSFMGHNAPVSVLYPFNYGFYRKSGYHNVSERLMCSFSANKLMQVVPAKFVECTAAEAFRPQAIYERFSKRFCSHAVRSEKWISWRMEEAELDGGTTAISENAYAIYVIKDGAILIQEVAYDSVSDIVALISALASQTPGIGAVRCPLPVGDAPHDLFDDSRAMFVLEPYLMVRALDVNWLVGMQVSSDIENIVRAGIIKIDDPLGFVNGTWKIGSGNGVIDSVERSEFPAEITLSLREFTQAIIGHDAYFMDMY